MKTFKQRYIGPNAFFYGDSRAVTTFMSVPSEQRGRLASIHTTGVLKEEQVPHRLHKGFCRLVFTAANTRGDCFSVTVLT